MEIMRIEAAKAEEAPELMILARHLLPKAREFFQNPENERKFQEWKARRNGHERDEH